MKIIAVLNRRWSIKLFLKVLQRLKPIGVQIPIYVVALAPVDERILLSLYGDDIKKFISFPIEPEDLVMNDT